MLDVGSDRFSWRKFASLLRFLPRDAVTVQAIVGPEAQWSENEYLLALMADSLAHLGWMYSTVHGGKTARKPPKPLPRPGEARTESGAVVTHNVTERTEVTAGSLSFAELDAAIARQTGTPTGILEEV